MYAYYLHAETYQFILHIHTLCLLRLTSFFCTYTLFAKTYLFFCTCSLLRLTSFFAFFFAIIDLPVHFAHTLCMLILTTYQFILRTLSACRDLPVSFAHALCVRRLNVLVNNLLPTSPKQSPSKNDFQIKKFN